MDFRLRFHKDRDMVSTPAMDHHDDEMLDDIHEGVTALRAVVLHQAMPLSEKATVTLQRLEKSVPIARNRLRLLKQKIAEGALKAARKTDKAMHAYPWFFTLSALGAGLVAGWLLAGSGDKAEN